MADLQSFQLNLQLVKCLDQLASLQTGEPQSLLSYKIITDMHIHLHVVFTRYELRKVLETNYAQVQIISRFQTGKLWPWEAKGSCPSLHGVATGLGTQQF